MRISTCLQLQEAGPRPAPASWNEWHPHCPTWHECCHARVRVLARLDRLARGRSPSHSDRPPHHPGVWHSAGAGAATPRCAR